MGWIHTARSALGMSGASLARRMGLSTSAVANLEKSEQAGTTTLRSLREAAEAMGFELVYALVPQGGQSADDLIQAQAERKARRLVDLASTNMALEKQQLTDAALAAEVKRLRDDFAHALPRDFWDDEHRSS